MGFVGLLAMLDYGSTFAFLRFSGNSDVYESSLMASWALERNGFKGLLLADLLAVAATKVVRALRATFVAAFSASAGFKIDSTMSASRTRSSYVDTASIPAARDMPTASRQAGQNRHPVLDKDAAHRVVHIARA